MNIRVGQSTQHEADELARKELSSALYRRYEQAQRDGFLLLYSRRRGVLCDAWERWCKAALRPIVVIRRRHAPNRWQVEFDTWPFDSLTDPLMGLRAFDEAGGERALHSAYTRTHQALFAICAQAEATGGAYWWSIWGTTVTLRLCGDQAYIKWVAHQFAVVGATYLRMCATKGSHMPALCIGSAQRAAPLAHARKRRCAKMR